MNLGLEYLPLITYLTALLLMSVVSGLMYQKWKAQEYLFSTVSLGTAGLLGGLVIVKLLPSNDPSILSFLSVTIILTLIGLEFNSGKKEQIKYLIYGVTAGLCLILYFVPGSITEYIIYLLVAAFVFIQYKSSYLKLKTKVIYEIVCAFYGVYALTGLLSLLFNVQAMIFVHLAVLALGVIASFVLMFRQMVVRLVNAQYSSITDPLTGLFNRRFFIQKVDEATNGQGIIFIDIDNFKKVNDEQGHQVGDEALRAVANLCKQVVGPQGVVGRFGGEEMVILVYQGTELNLLAERIRELVETQTTVTISVGYAYFNDEEPRQKTIDYADKNMYEAKMNGKNQVFGSIGA